MSSLGRFSTYSQGIVIVRDMAENAKPTANAEAPRKGIRKVNLSDLAGSLNQRGRERYNDPELAQAMRDLLADGQPFIWEAVTVTGKTDKARIASKAKWRNRAKSVMASQNEDVKLHIRWTIHDEMVIALAGE